MNDLKIIDELLCHIKQVEGLTWEQMESHTHITNIAMTRLYERWRSMWGLQLITLSLADHFRSKRP